jgi:hypothetical protein
MNTLPALAHRQRGVILIMYALVLTLILGFTGLVVDLGVVYLRRAQLQAAADSIAIGAALKLNGTAAGIDDVVMEAQSNAGATPALSAVRSQVADALRFSADPHAGEDGWVTVGGAKAAPAAMRYVRVDTGTLPAAVRQVQPLLMGMFGGTGPFDMPYVAIAGRRTLNVTPLAICARNNDPNHRRDTIGTRTIISERVPYGFRVGVTYNLLNLNPNGMAPVFYYVDPQTPPGVSDPGARMTDAIMAPYMCSGTLAYPRIGTGNLNVSRRVAFGLAKQLNSRFNEFEADESVATHCTRTAAPPDTNIKSYVDNGVSWNPVKTTSKSAAPAQVGAGLATVADLSPAALTAQPPAPGAYGTRWSFRSPRTMENVKIADTAWNSLYPSIPAAAKPTSWPADAPYFRQNAATYFTAPSPATPARLGRRLLYIPLLQCGGNPDVTTATVLAYGRFFMVAPATSGEIPGEFAGVVSLADEGSLAGEVELFR